MIENVLRIVFTGSKRFEEALRKIDDGVKAYNAALDDLGLLATMETRHYSKLTFTTVEGIKASIQNINRKVDRLPSELHADLRYEPSDAKLI